MICGELVVCEDGEDRMRRWIGDGTGLELSWTWQLACWDGRDLGTDGGCQLTSMAVRVIVIVIGVCVLSYR